ncbi:hypothetical protein DFH09DRAFT_1077835 [Mycena vulgaris]|nr:hypothetical protein DFH09DRAFT_1077835 [Mycena vulgaris]
MPTSRPRAASGILRKTPLPLVASPNFLAHYTDLLPILPPSGRGHSLVWAPIFHRIPCAKLSRAVPLNGRIPRGRRMNAGCSDTNNQLSGSILSELRNQEPLLNVQLSLLSASRIADKVTDKIALAALNGNEPARDNAHRLILSGLNDANNTLLTLSAFEIFTPWPEHITQWLSTALVIIDDYYGEYGNDDLIRGSKVQPLLDTYNERKSCTERID